MSPAPPSPRRGLRLPARLAAVVAGLVVATGARGTTPPAAAAPTHAAVEVVFVEGEPVRGPLFVVTADAVRLDGRAEPIALDTVRELRFAATPAPAPAAAADAATPLRAVLRGDEVVRGRLVTADDLGIELVAPGLDPLRLVFDVVRRIEADGPDRGPCAEPGRELPPREGADVAYTHAGDAYAGTLEGATGAGVVIAGDGAKRTVRWADLAVLHVDEPALPAPTGRVAELETRGGTRLPATTATCDGVLWTLKTRSGLDVRVPVAAVAVVRFSGGRFVHASALPFTSEFTPYYPDDLIDAWYGARADRTAEGCPLRIAGVPYRHGIAVHAKSVVKLPLAKRFARFHGRVGIDDEALGAPDGPPGDVTARVLADGREVWSSRGSVKGGEPARAVGPLDVTGVETLVLEVDFGGGGHVMDRADWVDLFLELPR